MPSRPGFQPYGGTRLRLTRRKMVASEAKDVGDVLVHTASADTLELGASNGLFVAVYMDAPRTSADADYASTPYKTVMLITPDTQWYAVREAGTLTAADVGADVDLNSADGLAVDTSTNDDFHIDMVLDSNTCVGRFNNGFPRTL